MTQAQETKCLSPKQIETVMTNWFKILNVKRHSIMSSGKPVFSKENEEKWGLQHITKFADNYTLYKCEMSNDEPNMYFIVLETNKFDKLNISACCWYYHLFENELDKSYRYPRVYICPAYVVTDTMLLHVPVNVLPCLYRFVSLCEVYPIIGSSEQLYGLSYDYKILPPNSLESNLTYNGRAYTTIYDYDPMVKILNALPGDIIQYKRVLNEGSPYGEYYRREVTSTVSEINIIALSGLCNGFVQ